MGKEELSREELFALVWKKSTVEVAKELGVSDVAVAKLCARLQVDTVLGKNFLIGVLEVTIFTPSGMPFVSVG